MSRVPTISISHSLKICLIGPGAPSSNPRLIKEALALTSAGYQVRVVCGSNHSMGSGFDLKLLNDRPWSSAQCPKYSKWRRLPNFLRKRLAEKLSWSGASEATTFAAWAESESIGDLIRLASQEYADLYIGHYLPGLYAARAAARRHNALYGFDIEDSHVDELPDMPEFAGRRRSRERLERALLKDCRHLIASSPLIADRYRERYGVEAITLLNVFPLSEAPASPVTTPYLRGEGPPTLYWFSQTIGAGRGLEEVVRAMGMMSVPAMLHLRGIPANGYRDALEQLATHEGAGGRIVWHPPGEPDEMVRLASEYDAGLALELCEPPNRAICLTNKAFTYLLGGVPVVFSRTPAQEKLHAELGRSAIITDTGHPRQMADALTDLFADRSELSLRRDDAWKVARERFNWDVESVRLLALVNNVFQQS